MKRRVAVLAMAALLVAGCGSEKAEPERPAADGGLLGFRGTTVGGQAFDGSGLKGRPVVLWFWAPWCPKCQSEGPSVAEVAKRLDGRITFVGVGGLDKSKPRLEEFVRRTGTGGFVQLDDRAGALYRHFGVTEQSSYVFVNPEGGTNTALGPLSVKDLTELAEMHTR